MNKSNLKWDCEKLRQLYQKKILSFYGSRFDEYLYALAMKIEKAHYHSQQAKDKWQSYFHSKSKISVKDPGFKIITKESSAETEALIQILHSLGDVMAQIVNSSILVMEEDNFSEHDVIANKVCAKINNKEVKKVFAALLNCAEYKYIAAFNNTIKHRKLIDTAWETNFVYNKQKAVVEQGIKFKEFICGGKSYRATWAETIQDKYKLKIINLTIDTGIALTQELAAAS